MPCQQDSCRATSALRHHRERVFDPDRAPLTCGQLAEELDRHGMAVILILFSVPAALPVPAAGYSTLLSIPLLAHRPAPAGRDTTRSGCPPASGGGPSTPARFNRRVVNAMLRLVQFVERFSSPRLVGLVRSTAARVVIGLVVCALACAMLLPVPGTNTAPAFGIFLIGFSLLEDDGVLLLAGILCSLAAIFIALLIVFFGYRTYLWLKDAGLHLLVRPPNPPPFPAAALLPLPGTR